MYPSISRTSNHNSKANLNASSSVKKKSNSIFLNSPNGNIVSLPKIEAM
jgi:hypothetical protein